jgi:hypothetical protein
MHSDIVHFRGPELVRDCVNVELTWVQSTIRRHAPVFYLHPDDKYMPCSAEFFMEQCELQGRGINGNDVVILPKGSVTGEQLLIQQDDVQSQWTSLRLCFKCHEARFGVPLAKINSVPVYVHIKAVVADDNRYIEAFEINYITLYAYNGEYTVIPGLVQAGAHDGDIEHITARVCPESGDLLAMWYNSHRPRDGEWVEADSVPRVVPSGRPIAYVALHGHGTYPRTGTIHRHFWLGNDKCSDRGVVWDPERLVLLPSMERGLQASVASGPPASCTLSSASTMLPVAACTSRGYSYSVKSPVPRVVVGVTRVAKLTMQDQNNRHGSGGAFPMVIVDDPCAWLFFRGFWGQTPAIIQQSWYRTAESPISRSPLQRLFLHFWPEVKSLMAR